MLGWTVTARLCPLLVGQPFTYPIIIIIITIMTLSLVADDGLVRSHYVLPQFEQRVGGYRTLGEAHGRQVGGLLLVLVGGGGL